MIRFFLKKSFLQPNLIMRFPVKTFARKIKGEKGSILSEIENIGIDEDNQISKMIENQTVDSNMEKLIMEKIDQGKTDHEIISDFMGSLNGGGNKARSKIPKQIKSKDKITDKEVSQNQLLKSLNAEAGEMEKMSILYNNNENIIANVDPNKNIKLKSRNLNNLKTQLEENDMEKYQKYKFKERGVSKKLLDQIPFSEQVRKDLETPDVVNMTEEKQLVKKDDIIKGKINLKNYKEGLNSGDEDDRSYTENFEELKNFKELVEEDMNSEFKQLKSKIDKDEEKRKIAKMTNKPIFDSNGKDQDEKLRRTAILLGKLWQLTPAQKRHWYRQLKREEKEVAKKMIKLKQREEKKKLKKLSKKWKLENDDNVDINYLEDKAQEDEIKIPSYCENFKEYSFFEDDIEFMKHYKRTCKNIENSLEEIINSYKQSYETGIRKNHFIQISKVKLNKAMTVVHVWWDIPFLSFGELNKGEKIDRDELSKNIELKLNQSIPYIRSKLTNKVGLKYAPEIRFYRDNKIQEIIDYRESINNLTNSGKSNSIFQEAYEESFQNKKPLSYEQDQRLKSQYEKELENILKSVDNPKEREELENLNMKIKEKKSQELAKEFFGVMEGIELKDEPGNEFLKDIKNLSQSNQNQTSQADTPIKSRFRNPLEMNTFTPKDKIGQRMVRERDKFLNSVGLSIKDFKGKNNELKDLNVNTEVLNFIRNYEYQIPTQALEERKKGIKNALKDLADISKEKNKGKQIPNQVVKEGNINKINNERVHHKKKKRKSEEFWNNLESYYDK